MKTIIKVFALALMLATPFSFGQDATKYPDTPSYVTVRVTYVGKGQQEVMLSPYLYKGGTREVSTESIYIHRGDKQMYKINLSMEYSHQPLGNTGHMPTIGISLQYCGFDSNGIGSCGGSGVWTSIPSREGASKDLQDVKIEIVKIEDRELLQRLEGGGSFRATEAQAHCYQTVPNSYQNCLNDFAQGKKWNFAR